MDSLLGYAPDFEQLSVAVHGRAVRISSSYTRIDVTYLV